MSGSTTELSLALAVDGDDNADYLVTSLANSLRTMDALFNNVSGHNHGAAHQGGTIANIPASALADGIITSAKIADGAIQTADLAGSLTLTSPTTNNETANSPTLNNPTLAGTVAGNPTYNGTVTFSGTTSFTTYTNFNNDVSLGQ